MMSRIAGLLLASLLMVSSVALIAGAVEPSAPEGPEAETTVRAALAAFNSGEHSTVEAFVKTHFSAEALAEFDAAARATELDYLHRDLGKLELRRILNSSEAGIKAVVAAPESEIELEINLDMAAGKLTNVRLHPIPAPISKPLTEAELAAELKRYLAKMSAAQRFSGVVMVAKDGRPIAAAAQGRSNGSLIAAESRFNTASIAKMFTAVAVLQLVQEGKLELTDTMAKLLPGHLNKPLAEKITVHHLLSHTAGLSPAFKPELQQAPLERAAEYEKYVIHKPPVAEVGSAMVYTNYSYQLLGMIVEKVTGESYYDQVEKRVLKPAGMTKTGFPRKTALSADAVIPMTREGSKTGERASGEDMLPLRGGPGAGAYATAKDLLRFAEALRTNKLLKSEMSQLMTKVHTAGYFFGPRQDYGYGCDLHVFPDDVSAGHRGIGYGINNSLQVYMKSGYAFVVLSNYDPPASEVVAAWLHSRLPLAK